MREALTKLLKVKSIVTLVMTIGLILMLTGVFKPSSEILSLYCTTYGAIITYFFTKKDGDNNE